MIEDPLEEPLTIREMYTIHLHNKLVVAMDKKSFLLEEQLEKLEQQLEKMEEYLMHKPTCPKPKGRIIDDSIACTCKLDDVMKGI